jgi:hypothetical protein
MCFKKLHLWINEPPPEKDLEIGVGRYVAWQTPLHRKAIRKALQSLYKAREVWVEIGNESLYNSSINAEK